jgi:hypothetical protein
MTRISKRLFDVFICNGTVTGSEMSIRYVVQGFAAAADIPHIAHLRQECHNSKFGILSYWYRKKGLQMHF